MKNDNYPYRPKVGERCLVSPPNCDDDNGYAFFEFDILWADETFVLYGNDGKWPSLHRWSMVAMKPLLNTPSQPGYSGWFVLLKKVDYHPSGYNVLCIFNPEECKEGSEPEWDVAIPIKKTEDITIT